LLRRINRYPAPGVLGDYLRLGWVRVWPHVGVCNTPAGPRPAVRVAWLCSCPPVQPPRDRRPYWRTYYRANKPRRQVRRTQALRDAAARYNRRHAAAIKVARAMGIPMRHARDLAARAETQS
jgi:hypothetical protein